MTYINTVQHLHRTRFNCSLAVTRDLQDNSVNTSYIKQCLSIRYADAINAEANKIWTQTHAIQEYWQH